MPFARDESFQYCRWLTQTARSNFMAGLRLLSPARRQAMEVVYAFCRAADDVVDSEASVPSAQFIEQAQQELALWRRELALCAEGYPTHPIAVALQSVMRTYQIPIRYFEDLLAGVEMDLYRQRYRSFEELRVYCEHVASVVGLISVRVFGCKSKKADDYAVNLGIALQLTNILRDIKTDAERGRVYVPLAELKQFGYTEEDLQAGRSSEAFKKLMYFQCTRAREFFEKAQQALTASGEKSLLLPARIMAGVYERILCRIEQMQYEVFSTRIAVPKSEQLWVVARTLAGF